MSSCQFEDAKNVTETCRKVNVLHFNFSSVPVVCCQKSVILAYTSAMAQKNSFHCETAFKTDVYPNSATNGFDSGHNFALVCAYNQRVWIAKPVKFRTCNAFRQDVLDQECWRTPLCIADMSPFCRFGPCDVD